MQKLFVSANGARDRKKMFTIKIYAKYIGIRSKLLIRINLCQSNRKQNIQRGGEGNVEKKHIYTHYSIVSVYYNKLRSKKERKYVYETKFLAKNQKIYIFLYLWVHSIVLLDKHRETKRGGILNT